MEKKTSEINGKPQGTCASRSRSTLVVDLDKLRSQHALTAIANSSYFYVRYCRSVCRRRDSRSRVQDEGPII